MNAILIIGLFLLYLITLTVLTNHLFWSNIIIYLITGIGLSLFWTGDYALKISAEIGVILLFFLYGLKLQTASLMTHMKKIWAAGILDFIVCFLGTLLISLLFGMALSQAIVLGCIVYPTSSSIVFSLMNQNKNKDPKIKEFVENLLIFEDFLAPTMLTLVPFFVASEPVSYFTVSKMIIGFCLLLIFLYLGSIYTRKHPKLLNNFSKNPDTILGLLGVILCVSGIGIFLGISEVLGALLTGIVLSEFEVRSYITKLLTPVKDIFLPIFFIWFGMSINLRENVNLSFEILLITLILWAILAKFIVGFLGGLLFGLTKRQIIEVGLSISSRGELSILFATFATDRFGFFINVFILCSAIIGIFLFRFSETLSDKIYSLWSD